VLTEDSDLRMTKNLNLPTINYLQTNQPETSENFADVETQEDMNQNYANQVIKSSATLPGQILQIKKFRFEPSKNYFESKPAQNCMP